MSVKDLQKLKNLASFSAAQLEKLASNLLIKTFNKNDIIFDQDEEAKFIYLSLSGIVRVSYISSHERQTTVNLLPAGEFFGLDSVDQQGRHAFRCEAFDECKIGSIKPQTFINVLLGTPYDIFLRWYDRIFPDQRFSLERLRAMDADVRLRAKRILAPNLPIDDLNAKLSLNDGVLRFAPAVFGVADGRMEIYSTFDGSKRPSRVKIDSRLKQLNLKRFLAASSFAQKTIGPIGGRINISGT